MEWGVVKRLVWRWNRNGCDAGVGWVLSWDGARMGLGWYWVECLGKVQVEGIEG